MRAQATYDGSARVFNKYDEREERRIEMKGKQDTDLPLGDGNARVGATRGFKEWFSGQLGGLTVESTVSVSIVCGQSEDEIRAACEESARIAENMALSGAEEMRIYLNDFEKNDDKRTTHPNQRRR